MSPIDASRLDISLSEGEQWRRTLSVTVPVELVKEEQANITKKLAGRLNIKGFRAGKVPKSVIARRFGGHVEREALDHIIQEAYKTALSSQALRPISEGEIQDVNFTPDEPLSFKVSFDVQPEIVLDKLGGFKAERPTDAVDDDAIANVLSRLQDQRASWTPVEKGQPSEGTLVSLMVTRLDGEEVEEARKYEFVVGEGQAIPDIENALKTLEIGEEGEFDITFPEDFPDEDRRGQTQKIKIVLDGFQSKELPALGDDFAKELGGFDSFDLLREKISGDLAEDAKRQADASVRNQLLLQVTEANAFDVPASMVEGYLNSIIGSPEGADPEKLAEVRDQLRGEAESTVKRMLAVDRIAELKKLTATEDDIDDRVQEIADASGESVSKVYANLQKSGRIASLEQEITENKVFEFLKSESEITEAP